MKPCPGWNRGLLAVVLGLSGASASLAAEKTDWSVFKVGDAVEIDAACTGNFRRMSIESIGPDPYSASARKYGVLRQDGSRWTFSGPGIVAPCIRLLSAAAAAPVLPSGSSQPFEGLYLQLQPTGTAYAAIHYYFWKDGRYCEGLPAGGLDRQPADFATLALHQSCGEYRVSGARITLQRQGQPKPVEMPLRHVRGPRDGFEMNGYTTSPVAAYKDDETLEGRYSASVVGDAMTRQVYVFRRDGTYSFQSTPVTSRDGPARAWEGRYRLSGNTLQTTGGPDGGRQTIYPFPSRGLMIAGSVFSH